MSQYLVDYKTIEAKPIKYDYEAMGKALFKVADEITKAFHNIPETIIKPFYDRCLLAASAKNPKWYFYYKNAKTMRTREKYRLLLQNKFLLMAMDNRDKNPFPAAPERRKTSV
jgi:hypothetical protein